MATDTTVNDISDIVRILREHPEWADALRGILLGEEILKLPAMVAELVESNRLIQERLDGLDGRMGGLDGRMDGLDGRMDGLEGRMDGLEGRMGGLDGRMDGLDGRMDGLEGRMDGLENSMGELKDGMVKLESRMDRLEGEVGNLVGHNLEVRAHHNIASLVHEELDIVRIRVLKSLSLPSYDIISNLIDAAEDAGRISMEQGLQVMQLDIILSAEFKEDRSRVGVAIEVSRIIDDSDITRARERADMLSAAVETPTIAAVLGGSIQPQQQRLADGLGVHTVINQEAMLR